MKNEVHKFSKILSRLLLCVSLITIGFLAVFKLKVTETNAYTLPTQLSQSQSLSQLTEAESINFIIHNNIEKPDGWLNEPGFGSFVKNII